MGYKYDFVRVITKIIKQPWVENEKKFFSNIPRQLFSSICELSSSDKMDK